MLQTLIMPKGDFSFALSLVEHHKCEHVTATCYDPETTLYEKYPQTREILSKLLRYGVDQRLGNGQHLEPTEHRYLTAEETIGRAEGRHSSPSEWQGLSPSASVEDAHRPTDCRSTITDGSTIGLQNASADRNVSFHASVSAYSLPKHKPVRRRAPYNKIIFNFPHVGGLSTDVNRQVRANQELLVAFFKSCRPLLASGSNPVVAGQSRASVESPHWEGSDGLSSLQDEQEAQDERTTTGQVIITLFEGEPYSLWNIRDLARHCGFKVVTSWRFPWEAYPQFRHARTAGQILRRANVAAVGGNGNTVNRKKKGGWRGEEREARGYVFEMVDEEPCPANATSGITRDQNRTAQGPPRSKRRKSSSSSEE